MQKGPPTPKGFRDINPENAKKRRTVISKIADVLEENGFVPLETPTVEFAQTLEGKYGEEEKLIYKFEDRGGRELALRYDLTVPLARYIANNQQLIEKGPFRRYQIGQVFRGENPQAGRYREFTQFDFDTAGSNNLEEDAKIISTAIRSIRKLGLKEARMAVNDRDTLSVFVADEIRVIDKIEKIGISGVEKELKQHGKTEAEISKVKKFLTDNKPNPPKNLQTVFDVLKNKYKLVEDIDFYFDHTLARGLDYYTGSIFELKPSTQSGNLSIGAGGRYDNLIGMFVYPDKGGAEKDIPAVGFSFGIDRLIEAISG